jgi:autotransporter-associated beta strand protein
VTITDGTLSATTDIIGGESSGTANAVTVNGNQVNLSGTDFGTAKVFGGQNLAAGAGEATVSQNVVTIDTGSVIAGNVTGGASEKGKATFNEVRISGGAVNAQVAGGHAATGDAEDNKVTISGGTLDLSAATDKSIFGGKSDGAGNALRNEVIINAASGTAPTLTLDSLAGGTSAGGDANANKVTVSSGSLTLADALIGGDAALGRANNNEVTLSGGTLNHQLVATDKGIYGGRGETEASGNKVTLNQNDGTLTATTTTTIIGGKTAGTANANTIEITSVGSLNDVTHVAGGESSGATGTISVDGNTVTITGSTMGTTGDVVGGLNETASGTTGVASVKDNTVTISDSTLGHVTGGSGEKGEVKNNIVTILDSSVGALVGGESSADGEVSGNRVTVQESAPGKTQVSDSVMGGGSDHGDVNANIVQITGGSIDGAVTGGNSVNSTATNEIKENEVTISGGTISGNVVGGTGMNESVLDNKVTVTGGNIDVQSSGDKYIRGGESFGEGTVTGNIVTINESAGTTTVSADTVQGGFSLSGIADRNEVNVTGSTVSVSEIAGGAVGQGDSAISHADENIVRLADVSAGTADVFGGLIKQGSGNVRDNEVTITNSQVNDVTGGKTQTGNVTGNVVTLGERGSSDTVTVNGNVVGGNTTTGNATGNIVNILSEVGFGSSSSVSGGKSSGGDAFTGNTLNKSHDSSIPHVDNFEYINFEYTGDSGIGQLVTDNGQDVHLVVDKDQGGNQYEITVSGTNTITGAGAITKEGDGKLILTDANDYQGGTTIKGGVVEVGNSGSLGTGPTQLDGGSLEIADGVNVSSGLALDGNDNIIDVETGRNVGIGGVMTDGPSGSGGFIKTGGGTLELSGANDYTGTTVVEEGKLVVVTDNTITGSVSVEEKGILSFDSDDKLGGSSNSSSNFLNGGTLELTGTGYQKDWTISADGKVHVPGGQASFDGDFNGSGNLVKTGAGDLALTNDNSFTGSTRVEEGSIILEGSLASTDLTIFGGATFDATNAATTPQWTALTVTRTAPQVYATYSGDLNVQNGEMYFYAHPDVTHNEVLLNVNGNADITNAIVHVGVQGNQPQIQKGDQIVLMKTTGNVVGAPQNQETDGQNVYGMQGVTLNLLFTLSTTSDQLIASLEKVQAAPQADAVSEGSAAGLAFVSNSGELVAHRGLLTAVEAANRDQHQVNAFGAIEGGVSKYNTGSSVKVKGVSLITGAASNVNNVVVGGFLEWGNGSADTKNDFPSYTVNGEDDLHYYGLGALARWDSEEGYYADGSIRFGRIQNEFSSKDFIDAYGNQSLVDYETKSLYYGLHVGGGYVWSINDAHSVDFYSRVLWTHVNGDTVKLTTNGQQGETLKFSAANSTRFKLGARYLWSPSASIKPYAGLAWEYEFSGKADVSANGNKIDAASIKGSSAVGEIGVAIHPEESAWSFDLGLTGYAGKRKGGNGFAKVSYQW